MIAENWDYSYILLRYHVKWQHYPPIPFSISSHSTHRPVIVQANHVYIFIYIYIADKCING